METFEAGADDNGAVKDLLLEDYRYRADALKSSEQLGEARFSHFIAVATLLLGGVAGLGTQEHGPKGDTLKVIVISVIFSLLVIGVMSLRRLMIRNERTDECKRDLDHIRQTIKDRFDKHGLLVAYNPVGRQHLAVETGGKSPLYLGSAGASLSKSTRAFGGLSHMMAATNSLLLASLAACWVLPFERPLAFGSSIVRLAFCLAIAIFALSFVLQVRGLPQPKSSRT